MCEQEREKNRKVQIFCEGLFVCAMMCLCHCVSVSCHILSHIFPRFLLFEVCQEYTQEIHKRYTQNSLCEGLFEDL